jgi:hypothetical protein
MRSGKSPYTTYPLVLSALLASQGRQLRDLNPGSSAYEIWEKPLHHLPLLIENTLYQHCKTTNNCSFTTEAVKEAKKFGQ